MQPFKMPFSALLISVKTAMQASAGGDSNFQIIGQHTKFLCHRPFISLKIKFLLNQKLFDNGSSIVDVCVRSRAFYNLYPYFKQIISHYCLVRYRCRAIRRLYRIN